MCDCIPKVKKKKEIEEKELITKIDLKTKIKYVDLTERLGKAEFVICPVFRKGYLKKVFIQRVQQKKKEMFVLDLRKELKTWKINVFEICAWQHQTENVDVWRNYWCEEHKAIAFELYVPLKTNTIEIDCHFGNTITIRFVRSDD